MKLREIMEQIQKIYIPQGGYPVESTIACELKQNFCAQADIEMVSFDDIQQTHDAVFIGVMNNTGLQEFSRRSLDISANREWVYFDIDIDRRILLASSQSHFLFAVFSDIFKNHLENDVSKFTNWLRFLSFSHEKSTFDLFLTQYARLIRNFNREQYIREYARLGFSHIEVNALAFPNPFEQSVLGEFYSDFYTYCPALDQFVSSRLNEGIYPEEYLKANFDLLKDNARLAVKYGLKPGLLCFEPRSVPEVFFEKYPTLRGARVDHPFRSFKPRFSLALAHPLVKKHYKEMITKILVEVPGLEFLTIWSNDSGAGFEHTKSLYVGRNGGPYLIREWNSDEHIAQKASNNIADFFTLLRDAASKVNPDFRIITRLESFYGERPYLWPLLKDRIDVEGNSLLTKGWESPYSHSLYPNIPVLGSALHNHLSEKEKTPLEELHSRASQGYFYHHCGSHGNHEPLLGIPFPWLTHEKLRSCAAKKISALAHLGGLQPPDKVPYAVNYEVFRRFQFDSNLNIDGTIQEIAEQFTGPEFAETLKQGWLSVDLSVRNFVPLSIYTSYGIVWQRVFVRPLVPDIDAIPEKDRAYYENHMCTSIHNPNRIDLSRDVLFDLISPEYAAKAVKIIENNVWGPLDLALQIFEHNLKKAERTETKRAAAVFRDQLDRCRALRCLFVTLRNTATWIYAVRQYLETSSLKLKTQYRNILEKMMDSEIQNSRDLLSLWENSPVEWMIVSGEKETPFIYGENFPDLLHKKIELMEKYKNAEPRIDPGYMFRVKNNPYM
jgi:hypothetical protein